MVDSPPHIRAVLEALQFSGGSISTLQNLPESDWIRALGWCDARQLTLLLHSLFAGQLPIRLHEQMADRRSKYVVRFERLRRELFEIAAALDQAGLEFVVLKGITHSPALTPDPLTRAQGDIDLWMERSSISEAKGILVRLGYIPIGSSKCRHIDPMARPTDWRWRGDRFDPEMPISIELHYELWSEETEGIPVPSQEGFWQRKTRREFDGREFKVLRQEDLIGFAALHLLLHVLHGELPVQRAWEIGNFLHTHATDKEFWISWRAAHPVELRHIEVLIFWMVGSWFGCRWPEALDSEMQDLPRGVKLWLERFSLSPLKREWRPNKDEVWLHLALIPVFRAKTRVLLRRLLPIHGRAMDASRLAHHAWTFLPTVFQAVRWLRPTTSDVTSHR